MPCPLAPVAAGARHTAANASCEASSAAVVAEHALDERIDRPAVPAVEDLEGFRIARYGDLFEELLVGQAPRLHAAEGT
jgi:hypothetical protein